MTKLPFHLSSEDNMHFWIWYMCVYVWWQEIHISYGHSTSLSLSHTLSLSSLSLLFHLKVGIQLQHPELSCLNLLPPSLPRLHTHTHTHTLTILLYTLASPHHTLTMGTHGPYLSLSINKYQSYMVHVVSWCEKPYYYYVFVLPPLHT